MSPALNGSSAVRRFEGNDAIEIRDGITFDFYTGLPICVCVCGGIVPVGVVYEIYQHKISRTEFVPVQQHLLNMKQGEQ